jgi:hypothetical protein
MAPMYLLIPEEEDFLLSSLRARLKKNSFLFRKLK